MTNHYVVEASVHTYRVNSFFVVEVDNMNARELYMYLREEAIKNLRTELLDVIVVDASITTHVTLLKSET